MSYVSKLKSSFFITGTDTGVGKTVVTCALLHLFAQGGEKTVGIKPIAAGCEETSDGLRNDDAVALQQVMTVPLPYDEVNPIALKASIAPHLASDQSLSLSYLSAHCRQYLHTDNVVMVEGAGGWRVPLNHQHTLADLAIDLQLPVILVVGLRLGCINHALLSCEAIIDDGLPLAGWVANQIEPNMLVMQENIVSLQQRISAPCLGVIPQITQLSPEKVSQYLDIQKLTL